MSTAPRANGCNCKNDAVEALKKERSNANEHSYNTCGRNGAAYI